MNIIFKLIWNPKIAAMVVASELAKGKTRGAVGVDARYSLSLSMIAVALGGLLASTGAWAALVATPIQAQNGTKTGNASATGADATAAGAGSTATGAGATAYGAGSASSGANTAIGFGAISTGNTWGIGSLGNRRTDGLGLNILGSLSNASGIALGAGANSGLETGTALGSYAHSAAVGSLAVGIYSSALGRNSIAHGSAAYADGLQASAFGSFAVASAARAAAFGTNSTATGVDASAIGTSASASGARAIALGSAITADVSNTDTKQNTTDNTRASGADSVAIGTSSQATATRSAALGYASRASATGALALGANAAATAADAIAVGSSVTASGQNAVAIGSSAKATHTNGLALGTNADAAGAGVIAIGANTSASAVGGYAGIAIGNGAISNYGGNISMGDGAMAGGGDTIAIGRSANTISTAGANGQVALGVNAGTGANRAVAIGSGANATAGNSVALGASSMTTANLSVAGYNPGFVPLHGIATAAKGEVSVGSTDNERRVTNVAAGAVPTDAVNVSQLQSLKVKSDAVDVATLAALGGGAAYSPATGEILAPSYSVGGTTVGTVGAALTNIDGRVATNASTISAVQDSIGTINANVGAIGDRVANVEGSVTDLQTAITNVTSNLNSGEIGLVRQDANTLAITVAGDKAGASVSFAGIDGARALSGVASGRLAADSDEAVNGSQLFATNTAVSSLGDRVTSTEGDIGTINTNVGAIGDRVTTIEGSITGLGDRLTMTEGSITTIQGDIGAITTNVSNIDGRVTNVEGSVTHLQTEITNVTDNLNSGEVGLVRQDADTLAITVAGDKAGTSVNFAGSAGARVLSGVAAGRLAADSDEAVNGSQLFATNTAVSGLGDRVTATEGNITSMQGDIGAINTNVSNIDGRVTNVEGSVTSLQTEITNVTNNLNSGEVGLVRQDADTLAITVAGDKAGASVNIAGTAGARVLSGMAAGRLAADSEEAVNGSQLFATNTAVSGLGDRVTATEGDIATINTDIGSMQGDIGTINTNVGAIGDRVTNVEGSVTSLQTEITNVTNTLNSGEVGLVRQDADTLAITVAGDKAGASVNFAGTAGARVLSGVAAGRLAADSEEAVNGSQLFATNTAVSGLGDRVTATEGDIVTINTNVGAIGDRVTTVEGSVTSLSDRLTTTEGNITSIQGDIGTINTNVSNIDGRVTSVEGSVTNLTTLINNGSMGLVQQSEAGADLTVGEGIDGAAVNFAGTAGERKLIGVADGEVAVDSKEVVNGSQLHATNVAVTGLDGRVTATEGDIATINTDIGSIQGDLTDLGGRVSTTEGNITSIQGDIGTINTNVSNIDGRVTNVEGSVTHLQTEITDVTNNLNSGEVGLVRQDADTLAITVAGDKAGASVNFAGTAGARVLSGVAAGRLAADSEEAVNGSQLFATNNAVSGLDGRVATNEGSITSIQGDIGTINTNVDAIGDRVTTVEGSVTGLGDRLTTTEGDIAAVQGDIATINTDIGSMQGDLTDLGGRVSTTEGNITSIQGDIGTINTNVSNIDGRVTNVEGSVTHLQTEITNVTNNLNSGEVGLVRQDADTLAITVAADKAGTSVNIAGTAGARVLSGVAAGRLAADSEEAVNGSQLHATNVAVTGLDGRVTATEGDIATINTDIGTIQGGLTDLGGRVSTTEGNITSIQGDIGAINTSVSNIDGRVTNVEGSVTHLQTEITNVTNNLNSGEVGLVRQDDTLAITVAGDKAGASVNFAGTAGARKLIGVADGRVEDGSDEAVNGSQLFKTETAVSDLGDRVTNVEGTVNDLTTQIDNGSLGLVKQDEDSRDIEVAKGKDGTTVNFGGIQGARVLDGVAAGAVGATSLQAVNGSQLYAVSRSYAGALGGGATVNADGSISAPVYRVGGTEVNNVGDAVANLDGRTQQNSSDIADLKQGLGDLSGSLLAGNADMEARIDGLDGGMASLDGRVSQLEESIANGSLSEGGMVAGNAGEGGKQAAQATGEGALAIGNGAVASAEASTAIGTDSQASAANSVALGNGSVADRENTVSVGTKDNERQITNVAAGTEDTDAVNVAQLKQTVRYDQKEDGSTDYSRVSLGQQGTPVTMTNVARGRVAADSSDAINGAQLYDWTMNHANEFSNVSLARQIDQVERAMHAGVATALAARQAPYVPGHVTYAVGAAGYKSQGAVGVSSRYTGESGRWSLEGGFSHNGDGTGVYVGVSGVLGN